MHKILIISYSFLISCGIYSMAGSIPAHIKSISIPLVENQTSEFGISENITDYLVKEFYDSGILSIVDQENAHSILKGSITSVDEGPYTYNKEESVSEYRYRINIDIEWYDVENEQNLVEKKYSGFGAYGVSGDIGSDGIDNDNDGKIDDEDEDEFGEPRNFATRVAVRKIAEDILNDIMTTW